MQTSISRKCFVEQVFFCGIVLQPKNPNSSSNFLFRMFLTKQPEFSEEALSSAYSNWQKHCESSVTIENLLVFNVKEGWKPLCDFLEVEVPSSKFPRVNDRKSFNGWFIIKQEIKSVLSFLGFYFAAASVLYFYVSFICNK